MIYGSAYHKQGMDWEAGGELARRFDLEMTAGRPVGTSAAGTTRRHTCP